MSTHDDTATVHTFCRYCIAACGIEVQVEGNRVVKIGPDKDNPHSWRDFCAKGRNANQLVEHPMRIQQPMRRVGDTYVEATWEEAIDDIARRMTALIDADGPDAIGVYYGNPAGFSSSNLVFMNGWLDAVGTRNRYSVGSIDQNNVHVVAEQMYGSAFIAPVSDVDNCDYFLLVGANPAVSAWNWFETVPGGWRRALDRQKRGAQIVVVDPLRTETADRADWHLAIRPGQDWALLLAMVKTVLDGGLEHRQDCARLTGMAELRTLVAAVDIDDMADRCEIPRADIERLATEFARAPRAMLVTRTGVALTPTGTVGEWLGNVLNAITGRMDRPGGRRFERGFVDGLKLLELAKSEPHISRIAGRGMVAGAHALSELADEITTPGPGRIRAMVIDAGNPVVSGPNGAKLDNALADLDLLVAIDFVQRESHRHAHWLLPPAHWLERDDFMAFTSSFHDEPFAQLGRRAVEPPPGVRLEWRIFLDLSLAMKKPFFGVPGLNSAIKASRWISRVSRQPRVEFGPHWIDRAMVAMSRKIDGRKLTWRALLDNPHGLVLGRREFGHLGEVLRTPDSRIHVAPEQLLTRTRQLLTEARPQTPVNYPFHLGNRRRRHSMNSWLNDLPGLHPDGKQTTALINTADAAELGIEDGDRVRLSSPVNAIELCAELSDRPRRGLVVVDHGWGSRVFDPARGAAPMSYGVNRNLLVDDKDIDPLSQTSALGTAYVRLEPLRADAHPANAGTPSSTGAQ